MVRESSFNTFPIENITGRRDEPLAERSQRHYCTLPLNTMRAYLHKLPTLHYAIQ